MYGVSLVNKTLFSQRVITFSIGVCTSYNILQDNKSMVKKTNICICSYAFLLTNSYNIALPLGWNASTPKLWFVSTWMLTVPKACKKASLTLSIISLGAVWSLRAKDMEKATRSDSGMETFLILFVFSEMSNWLRRSMSLNTCNKIQFNLST